MIYRELNIFILDLLLYPLNYHYKFSFTTCDYQSRESSRTYAQQPGNASWRSDTGTE